MPIRTLILLVVRELLLIAEQMHAGKLATVHGLAFAVTASRHVPAQLLRGHELVRLVERTDENLSVVHKA